MLLLSELPLACSESQSNWSKRTERAEATFTSAPPPSMKAKPLSLADKPRAVAEEWNPPNRACANGGNAPPRRIATCGPKVQVYVFVSTPHMFLYAPLKSAATPNQSLTLPVNAALK